MRLLLPNQRLLKTQALWPWRTGYGWALVAMALTCVVSTARAQEWKPKRTMHLPARFEKIIRHGKTAIREPKIDDWHATVEGRGMTPEEAKAVALIKAREALLDFVHKHSYDVQHLPPDDFIISELSEISAPEVIQDDDNLVNVGKYLVRLDLNVTSEKFHKILDYDGQVKMAEHEQLVQGRLFFLGKVLLGIIALLSCMVCYARLEEITKGYYTAWLRLGAVGILCVVGAGLWLFF
jgi:hypothetical protein